MSSFDAHTPTGAFVRLISCVIDGTLLETMRDIDQPLLQVIDAMIVVS